MGRSWLPACVIKLSFHSFFSKTCANELWMVDLGFLLFPFPFSSHSFPLKTCNYELWMVRSWVPAFFISFPFTAFLPKPNMNFGWVDVEEGARSNTYADLIVSILFITFMAREHILSIVLRSCPATALVPMNFGWVDLGFLLLIKFSFQGFLLKNLKKWTLDG